jgi:hypothetical protein
VVTLAAVTEKRGVGVAIDTNEGAPKRRAPWEAMELDELGRLTDVIQQGGGKITITVGDPGEPRKVPATG